MNDSAELRVVNPLHLQQQQYQRYHCQYDTHPASLMVIDDFLRPEFASQCADFLQSQASYKEVYGLYKNGQGADSKQAWLSACPSERFFYYQMLDKTKENTPIGNNGLSFLKLRHLLHSNDFKVYLQTLVGQELGQATPIKVHRMQSQHFLHKHDDRHGNRQLAFILYLSPAWKAEFGGQLQLIDTQQKKHSVTPSFNRLLVFDVANHDHHYIENIVTSNTSINRLSINGWFLHPE